MSHQNKVSIDLIQDYQTLIGFSSDMIIFFGLSGKRTISTSQHVYELSAAGILVINPFVHYRLECLEPGESAGSEGASGYSANGGAGAFLDRLLCGK